MPKLTFRFVISNDWMDKGLEEAKKVVSNSRLFDHGWGNGYVAVHRNHPDFGKNYEEIPVDVYYGLTYGAPLGNMAAKHLKTIMDAYGSDEVLNEEDWWCFGFDTNHYQDNQINWPRTLVELETKQLESEFIRRQKALPADTGDCTDDDSPSCEHQS